MTPPAEVILLVDDEPGVLRYVLQVLHRAGYEVVAADEGEKAVDYARGLGQKLDLLLTDVRMPGVSGREVAERVCAARPGLPVLYMTGHHTDSQLQDGIEQGTVHLLSKPFLPAALTTKVRELLEGRGDLTRAAAG